MRGKRRRLRSSGAQQDSPGRTGTWDRPRSVRVGKKCLHRSKPIKISPTSRSTKLDIPRTSTAFSKRRSTSLQTSLQSSRLARRNSSTAMVFLASRRLALLPLLFFLLLLSSCIAGTVSAANSIARPKHHDHLRTFLKQPAPNSLLRGAQLTDLTALLQTSASEGLAYTTLEASGNEAVRTHT